MPGFPFDINRHRPLLMRACGVIYFGLCLFHLFSQRPLWLDENFIFQNIRDFSYLQIFGPLDHAQTFPRIPLVTIKVLGSWFGYHVLSLRVFSLLSMGLAFFLWRRIYREVFPDSNQTLLAVFAFSCSYYLSYYAGEFKHYSLDVLITGIFCYFLLIQSTWLKIRPKTEHYVTISVLAAAIFYSYASFFMVWIVAYNFFSMGRQNKALIILGLYYSVLVGLFFSLIYFFDLRHAWANGSLMSYWDSYFLCSESIGCFSETFWEGLRRMSTWWFGKGKLFMKWGSFLIPFFLYGLGRHAFGPLLRNFRQINQIGAITAILFLQLMAVGILKKYPFTGSRITLYLAPFVIYCLVKGMSDLKAYPKIHTFFVVNWLIYLTASIVNSVIDYWGFYQ